MSVITDATIHVHYATEALHAALVKPFPFDVAREQRFVKIDTDHAGGTKVFCSDLYAGAFNFVGVYDLSDWFLALPWSDVDTATLSAEGENEDFICISVFRGQHIEVQSECVDAWADKYRLTVTGGSDAPEPDATAENAPSSPGQECAPDGGHRFSCRYGYAPCASANSRTSTHVGESQL